MKDSALNGDHAIEGAPRLYTREAPNCPKHNLNIYLT